MIVNDRINTDRACPLSPKESDFFDVTFTVSKGKVMISLLKRTGRSPHIIFKTYLLISLLYNQLTKIELTVNLLTINNVEFVRNFSVHIINLKLIKETTHKLECLMTKTYPLPHITVWLCTSTHTVLIMQRSLVHRISHESLVFSQYTRQLLGEYVHRENTNDKCDISRYAMVYHERALHSYFIPYHRKYSGQHNQCNRRAAHDEKVG